MPVDTPPPTPLTATADKHENNAEALLHPDHHINSDDPHHPANHIPKLCAHFYTLGWVTGTGGGTSIKHGGKIYIAPSGVQKELMKPSDIFVLHEDAVTATTHETDSPKKATRKAKAGDDTKAIAPVAGKKRKRVSHHDLPYLRAPKQHRPSACTPLFLAAFRLRGAHCCIHTHSQWAVLVTLLLERSASPDVFEIEKLEQIKGIPKGRGKPGNLGFYDRLRLPVIENTAREEDLTESLEAAMEAYPDSYAVLVRRHGIYVWGEDVGKAKTVCESLDYIFQLAVEMRKLGLAWTAD